METKNSVVDLCEVLREEISLSTKLPALSMQSNRARNRGFKCNKASKNQVKSLTTTVPVRSRKPNNLLPLTHIVMIALTASTTAFQRCSHESWHGYRQDADHESFAILETLLINQASRNEKWCREVEGGGDDHLVNAFNKKNPPTVAILFQGINSRVLKL